MKGDMKTKLQHNGKKTGDILVSHETVDVRDKNNMLTEFRCSKTEFGHSSRYVNLYCFVDEANRVTSTYANTTNIRNNTPSKGGRKNKREINDSHVRGRLHSTSSSHRHI